VLWEGFRSTFTPPLKTLVDIAETVVSQVADVVEADAATQAQPAELAEGRSVETTGGPAELAEEAEAGAAEKVEVKRRRLNVKSGADRQDSHHHPPPTITIARTLALARVFALALPSISTPPLPSAGCSPSPSVSPSPPASPEQRTPSPSHSPCTLGPAPSGLAQSVPPHPNLHRTLTHPHL
jgi:hypothetical protein